MKIKRPRREDRQQQQKQKQKQQQQQERELRRSSRHQPLPEKVLRPSSPSLLLPSTSTRGRKTKDIAAAAAGTAAAAAAEEPSAEAASAAATNAEEKEKEEAGEDGATASASASAAASPAAAAEQQLQDLYWSKLRQGVIMTVPELKVAARQLGVARRSTRQLADMRFDWEFLAVRTPFRKRRGYMGSQIDKLGVIFVDMAELFKKWKVFNGQKYYILVGTDALSQKTACIPLANKSQASWEAGVHQMISKDFPLVTHIVTDADTAVAGKAFQAKIREKYNVKWYHLRTRSKSFRAEAMIG